MTRRFDSDERKFAVWLSPPNELGIGAEIMGPEENLAGKSVDFRPDHQEIPHEITPL